MARHEVLLRHPLTESSILAIGKLCHIACEELSPRISLPMTKTKGQLGHPGLGNCKPISDLTLARDSENTAPTEPGPYRIAEGETRGSNHPARGR